jgi:hypothetical protein
MVALYITARYRLKAKPTEPEETSIAEKRLDNFVVQAESNALLYN